MKGTTNGKNARQRAKLICLRLLFAALVAGCAAACTREEVPGPGFGGSDDDATVGYAVYRIAPNAGDGSRAAGVPADASAGSRTTDDGEPEESALAPGEYHYILFYRKGDANARPTAVMSLADAGVYADREDWITKTLVSIEPIKLDQRDAFIEFLNNHDALALLNFDSQQVLGETVSLESTTRRVLLEKVASKGTIEVDGQTYYLMTSSAYQGSDGKIVYASECHPDRTLWDTKSQALAAALRGEAHVITYVERVVAKIVPKFVYEPGYEAEHYLKRHEQEYSDINVYKGLTTDGNFDYETEYSQRGWYAQVVGYGLNGLERKSQLFKQLQDSHTYFANWSSAGYRRSYWTMDPHYEVNSQTVGGYPHQYRTALEAEDVRAYHTGNYPDYNSFDTENEAYYLKYFSYDDLRRGDALLTDPSKQPFYPLENTYDDSGNPPQLGDAGYFSAGTHLLVTCRLLLETDYRSGRYEPVAHLYRDQNDIYYTSAAELLRAKYTLLHNKALPGGNAGLNILDADWKNHRPHDNSYVTSISWPMDSRLEIYDNSRGYREATWEDFTLIPAELSGGDGMLMIAPVDKNDVSQNGQSKYRITNGSEWEAVSYNELVSLFHKLMGVFDHYDQGCMYYAAPVGHNATKLENCKSTVVGSVGVVRNHFYELNVKSVSQPGRSVDKSGQPIIPMLETKRNYIDVSINILDWHRIDQDGIPMEPDQTEPDPED